MTTQGNCSLSALSKNQVSVGMTMLDLESEGPGSILSRGNTGFSCFHTVKTKARDTIITPILRLW